MVVLLRAPPNATDDVVTVVVNVVADDDVDEGVGRFVNAVDDGVSCGTDHLTYLPHLMNLGKANIPQIKCLL